MFPTLSLGGLSIPTSGLIYIVGIWLLLIFVERSAKLAGRSADNYYNLAVVILVSAVSKWSSLLSSDQAPVPAES